MTRRTFWQFAPVAVVPPTVFASQVNWLDVHTWHGMARLTGLFVVSLPLLNALSRRLNDAGADGKQAFAPFAPLAILWVGYQCMLWGGVLIGSLGGAAVFAVWLIALLLLIPLHLVALVATLITTANVIGQALVPSDPGFNRYGPNPHEVPK